MQVDITREDGITIVAVGGDIDGRTAPELQATLPSWPGVDAVLLDLSAVTYLSSAGLRALLLIHRQVTGAGGRLALAGVAPPIQDTMQVTGFLRHFTLAPTRDAALAALAPA